MSTFYVEILHTWTKCIFNVSPSSKQDANEEHLSGKKHYVQWKTTIYDQCCKKKSGFKRVTDLYLQDPMFRCNLR